MGGAEALPRALRRHRREPARDEHELSDARRLASLDVQFLAEARYGSAILSRLAARGEGVYAHAIVREEDEKELARLVTRWVPRAGTVIPGAG